MENQLLEHLKGLPFHYEMNCYEKDADVFSYREGAEMGANASCSGMNLRVKGKTLMECIEHACDKICVDFEEDEFRVIDNDIQIDRLECDDGTAASEDEIERWKKGELRLWCATYRWEVKICFDQLGEEFLEEELKAPVLTTTFTGGAGEVSVAQKQEQNA